MTKTISPIILTAFISSILFVLGCSNRPAVVQPKLTDEQIQQIMEQEKGARGPAAQGQPTGEASKKVPNLGL